MKNVYDKAEEAAKAKWRNGLQLYFLESKSQDEVINELEESSPYDEHIRDSSETPSEIDRQDFNTVYIGTIKELMKEWLIAKWNDYDD